MGTRATDQTLPRSVTLRDGRSITLRAIREQDKDELAAAFDRLSDDTRYTRFMAPMRSLSERTLDAATHPDPKREFALVAVTTQGSDEMIVAGARYGSAPGSDSCEFAVTVDDDWQGLGIATYAMDALIGVARRRGFKRMEGYVFPSNTAMRGLAARLGFGDQPWRDDPTLRLVTLSLE
jgi:RimJ/RimL family protein N-acetyltransferase